MQCRKIVVRTQANDPARAKNAPRIPGSLILVARSTVMDWLLTVSFDNIVMSAITCLVLREVFLATLPDSIAGPGGWLIDETDD
jgi:hypothetical protein